jgi:hypothetical protein
VATAHGEVLINAVEAGIGVTLWNGLTEENTLALAMAMVLAAEA